MYFYVYYAELCWFWTKVLQIWPPNNIALCSDSWYKCDDIETNKTVKLGGKAQYLIGFYIIQIHFFWCLNSDVYLQ